jgi:diguanylate cyclase (GGDEF)-like protein
MTKVVDHLAELTGFRDRDVLDTTLVGALRDLLHPQQVAIHRSVGDGANQRWLTRARISSGQSVAVGDPIWTDFDALPALADFPARLRAMAGQRPVLLAGTPNTAVFALSNEQEAVGVLEVHTDRALTDAQQQLVASILRIYRNFQSLLDYSERDSLTGLLNRKTFDEAFYKLQAAPAGAGAGADSVADADRRHAAQQPQQHFLGVIDIDHFKVVNDTCGHLIGDEVLLLLSRLMRSSFRFHDRLYRFGGEEFVVLMHCADDACAGVAFERLRSAVQAFAFPQAGTITVSVGYTPVKAGDTPGSAFERADKAVYWSKNHGRNQVTSHAQLLASGALVDDARIGGVELF